MIEATIIRRDNHCTGFFVKGHAGYAEVGKDIVCAAVSTLTITLINSLNELSDVPVIEKQYISDQYPQILIPCPSDKTDLLIEMYKIGVEGVQEAFPQYVKLHLETIGAFIMPEGEKLR